MNKNKTRKWILIFGIILTLIFIFAPVLNTRFYHDITGAPEAVNGTMDLSGCNLKHHKVYLDGQWEFYWKQFILSDPYKMPDKGLIMEVPDNWSNYDMNGESLPAGGYGSYRLLLKNFYVQDKVTSFISDFGGAYRVYIDGQLTAQSGIASKYSDKIYTTPKSELFPVTLSKTASHEVVIEVATTRFSGLYMTPALCDYHHVTSEINIRSSIRMSLFGIALFAFISLITMYFFSIRRKLYSFWMPVLVLFILLQMMLTTEFYSLWQPILFFNLSYEATNEFMYFVTFMMKYLLIFLVQEQCGILFSKKEKIGFSFLYSLLYLLYLMIPQNIYNVNLSVIIPSLTFSMDVYLFIKMFKWRKRLNKYGVAAFIEELLVTSGLAVNSYYINGKIYMNMSMTMMIFFVLFLLTLTWVYAMRMGDLYDDIIISSAQLEMAEKQIAMQKEYYETLSRQMNEIREIKHDINHFTGVMLQLTEEGNLERLRTFLGEYCEKSKMDQLPVFCEHTISNSIIGYYYLWAKKYGISFESRCNMITQTIMSDSDLCIVLGNALENAIYACRQMDTSQLRFLSIESEKMKGQRLIKVTNSYGGQLNIKDGRYLSLKNGNAHGFGIRNMIKVIEAYGGYVKIEHEEGVFTFMAAIPEP